MNNQKISILQVVGRMDRGGTEAMIMNWYRHIDRNIIQFDFVVHTDKECAYDKEIEMLGGKVYHAPRYKGYNHLQYKEWWRKFFEQYNNYDIVHGHMRSTASIYLKLAKNRGVHTIAHSHSTSNGKGVAARYKNFLQRNINQSAEVCMACSKRAGKWLFNTRDFTVVPNAIEVLKYKYNEKIRKEIREEFGFDQEVVIGTVGRLTTAKNPEGILEIFNGVKECLPNTKLLWVGDGGKKKEILQLIETKYYQIRDSIIMVGTRDDVERLMQAMDVFILPSLWEGLGIVGIEAQAAGLPCICSKEVPEEIAITPLCKRVALENKEEWIKSILETVQIERREWTTQIDNAGFGIEIAAERIQNFYIQLVEDGKREYCYGGKR